jgi:TonB family protein
MLEWLLYAAACAAVLTLGGLAAERTLQLFALPQRWAWVGGIVASLVLPLGLPWLRAFVSQDASVAAAEFPILSTAEPTAPLAAVPPGIDGVWLAERVALGGWLLASAVLAGWLALSGLSMRRARKQWSRGVVEGMPVLISRNTGPAVVGCLRGDVVLPAWVLDWDDARRRLVVAHEREHLRARDPLLLMGGWLALALAPWCLPLWWQVRRLRLAVEVDCDRRVLRDALDVRTYGTLLLEVGRRAERGWMPATAFSEPRRTLERRLRMITWKRPRNRGWHAAAALAATALVPVALFALPAVEAPSLEPLGDLLTRREAAQEPAILWITAGDEFRIGRPDAPVLREEQLDAALAAMRDGEPGSGTLIVRSDSARVAAPGIGFSAIMAGSAACRAGFASVRHELVKRVPGSAELRSVGASERTLAPPCDGSGTPDTLRRARAATPPGPGASPAAVRPGAAPARAAGAGRRDTIPDDSVVVEFGRLDRLPDILNRAETLALVNRIYPDALRDAGISGRVLAGFDVRADGRVDTATIEIVSASHDGLRAPSREVAAQFRFRPGEYQGRAVRTRVHVPITWTTSSSTPAAVDGPAAPAAVRPAAAPSATAQTRALRIRGYDIPAIRPTMITRPVRASPAAVSATPAGEAAAGAPVGSQAP